MRRTIWLVLKHDATAVLRTPTFWIMTFLFPILLVGMNAYASIIDNRSSQAAQETSEDAFAVKAPEDLPGIGLVDDADIIQRWPDTFPSDLLIRYDDVAAARAALEADEIEQYVHIPADYMTAGDIAIYDKNFMIRESGTGMGLAFDSRNEWVLQHLIDMNLVENEQFLILLRNPVPTTYVDWHQLNPPPETNDVNDRVLAEIVSKITPYIFYFLLLIGSSYLMRSVVAEKENRTVEVLLLSLPPRQLLVGKILAISVVVVIQVAIWLAGGAFILKRGAVMLNVPEFTFEPGFLVWAVLYLIAGYLLYASVMAAVGAMANSAREGGQMMWILILPLLPTMMFADMFASEPTHWLTLTLSLFPLSAPSAMVTRLALGAVPLWQNLLSLAGLAATTYLFISLAARFFRSDNLLSSAAFKPKDLLTGWKS
ncbi:MAG: ABC transporter permease [Ardenticatenaceae bacterium]|nr:ABC transporter permease [Ardenticatenaceae bacterium]